MSFSEEFQAVELQALRDNTAQDVFNSLKALENYASLHVSRWIWELLQNARDSAIPESSLHVSVSINKNKLAFRHNGMTFSKDQVAHLIHHGSTKQEGQIGRFGTGFLSTHIISKVPRVSGRLSDGKGFAFVLDRTGGSPKELSESMGRSSKEFVQSASTGIVAQEEHSTQFEYPLEDEVRDIARQGVESLEAYTPYVLAFNHEIETIEILRESDRRLYRRLASKPLGGGQGETSGGSVLTTQMEIECSSKGGVQKYLVATATGNAVTVAFLAQDIAKSIKIQFSPDVPRFFMAFPLFGTESMGFPGVINRTLRADLHLDFMRPAVIVVFHGLASCRA